MRTLVTGISGYVGAALAPRLQHEGHLVRGFARDLSRVTAHGVPVVRGDAVSGEGLKEAMEGIDVAYYLIHAMEASPDGPFADRERRATENFVEAARSAGVTRIVYLGGLVPSGAAASPHLASRLAVEEALLAELPASIALRASIVIGARSRSFRFLVRLIERLPLIALPGWRDNRTQPIDGRDVLAYLIRAAELPADAGGSFDIAGPDVVSYRELIERISDEMLVGRPAVTLGRLTATPLASRVAAVIAGESAELIGPLMEGLEYDLLPRDGRAAAHFGVRLHSLQSAVERALRDWEAREELAAR
jgi:uncharacterized protein YbjT (DUF2867 family)